MFTLKIETTGSAFSESGSTEVARLLKVAADKVRDGYRTGNLLDINGNTCGKFRLTGVSE